MEEEWFFQILKSEIITSDMSNHGHLCHQKPLQISTQWYEKCFSENLQYTYFPRLTLESWYTKLQQMPYNRCRQQVPVPYKRLITIVNETYKKNSSWSKLGSLAAKKLNNHLWWTRLVHHQLTSTIHYLQHFLFTKNNSCMLCVPMFWNANS